MINQQELCVECYQALSNPICSTCLKRELDEWFKDMNVPRTVRKQVMAAIRREFSFDDIQFDMKCVICGQSEVAVCGYCFTKNAYLALKKLKVGEQLLESFLAIFSYWKGQEDFREHEHVGLSVSSANRAGTARY